MNEAMQELAEQLGVASTQIIEHYVYWYVVDSITWLFFGAVLAITAHRLDPSKAAEKFDGDRGFFQFAKYGLYLMALLIAVENIPDLLAPEGMSIHQLLKDIRG